jgi:hypothetical protein
MPCVFSSACGWAGRRQPSRSVLASSSVDTQKIEVFKTGSSAMPQSTNKKLGGAACRASCLSGFRANRNFAKRGDKKFVLDFVFFYVYYK